MGKERKKPKHSNFLVIYEDKRCYFFFFPLLIIFTFMIIINAIKHKIRIRESVFLKE